MIEAEILVAQWPSKGDNATIIKATLVTWSDERTPSYSSVANWLPRLGFGEDILEPRIGSHKLWNGFTDFKICAELAAFPFRRVLTHSRLHCPWSEIISERGYWLPNAYGRFPTRSKM
jgi:hypothetical protein